MKIWIVMRTFVAWYKHYLFQSYTLASLIPVSLARNPTKENHSLVCFRIPPLFNILTSNDENYQVRKMNADLFVTICCTWSQCIYFSFGSRCLWFFFSSMAFKQLTSPAAVCDETPQEMNAKGTRWKRKSFSGRGVRVILHCEVKGWETKKRVKNYLWNWKWG